MDIEQFKNNLPPLPNLHTAATADKSLEDLQADRILQSYAQRFKIFEHDFSKQLFRPHALGRIMGGLPKPLTARQTETLQAYADKISSGKGLTEKQHIDYGSLLSKKLAKPTISQGAETYLKEIFKEATFQRTKELKNKYLDKGIVCEPESLARIKVFYGVDIEKNTTRYENEFFTGEPDIILEGDEVWDIKSSWDYETFPMFDYELKNKDYYWQILAYMDLLGLKKGRIIFVLTDTPEQLIFEEKRRVSWQLGLIDESMQFDLPEDLDFEIERNLRYDDIPADARIKEFIVHYDENDVKLMHEMVKLCREYLVQLSKETETRFKPYFN